jgi:serine/threonine protein phosphatase PrpC
MSSQQAVDFVRKELATHGDPSRAAYAATKEAVYVKGSTDNVSVVVVRILETMPVLPDVPPPPPLGGAAEMSTSSDALPPPPQEAAST